MRRSPNLPADGRIGFSGKAKAYLALTKPRVIELLLVTTLPTMIFAARGFPATSGLMLWRHAGRRRLGRRQRRRLQLLHRPRHRQGHAPHGEPPAGHGRRHRRARHWSSPGSGAAAIAMLWFGANPLAGMLGVGAIFLYVVVYSLILKRRTTQNIVWGGAAGCMPVLIAWAAVTNTVEWPAVILFMVIFLWTPPHYWPLSMRYSDDYNAANVPMLGAVAGARIVSVQVVLYAWAMVACSLLMIPLGGAGIVYTVVAVAAGAWFLYEAHTLYSNAQQDEVTNKGAMKVFHGSISYLTLLFVALAVDPFVGPPADPLVCRRTANRIILIRRQVTEPAQDTKQRRFKAVEDTKVSGPMVGCPVPRLSCPILVWSRGTTGGLKHARTAGTDCIACTAVDSIREHCCPPAPLVSCFGQGSGSDMGASETGQPQ